MEFQILLHPEILLAAAAVRCCGAHAGDATVAPPWGVPKGEPGKLDEPNWGLPPPHCPNLHTYRWPMLK
eukprot:COSAG01_NODE_38364_length_490_cov_2.163683_1_plen_68_part_10